VVRVSGYRFLGSIPGASRFSEKQRVWNGVHSASWGQLRSYLEEKVAVPVKKTEINDRGNPLRWPRNNLYPQKVGTTLPTSGGRSVGIVRSRTKATEISLVFVLDSEPFAFLIQPVILSKKCSPAMLKRKVLSLEVCFYNYVHFSIVLIFDGSS
jgi:hypothetical protein